jgi:GAG-pre-integrase domain
LLRWHFRLGHLNFRSIQTVLRNGNLGTNPLIAAASKCEHPQCASCRFGKARKRPTGSTVTTPTNTSFIKSNDLYAGQCVSMDHFVVTEKGRLFQSRGKTSSDLMYTGGIIFCDHATGYLSLFYHVHQNLQETMEAKQRFEHEMFQHGVMIHKYHTDDGIFAARDFIASIEDKQQAIKFSGSGAHHQNDVAE